VASEASCRNSRACTKSVSPHSSTTFRQMRSSFSFGRPVAEWRHSQFYFAKPELAQREYSCVPLSNVILAGNAPKKLLTPGTEVALVYVADWACNFFGLNDCMIPTILLPTIRPNTDGSFRIELPDFSSDPIASQSFGGAVWQVHLREKNSVTPLQPQNLSFRAFANGLRIASSYPEILEFEGVKPDGLAPKPQKHDATQR
jgi:hypothetical protein